jgi:hypothetical protein
MIAAVYKVEDFSFKCVAREVLEIEWSIEENSLIEGFILVGCLVLNSI